MMQATQIVGFHTDAFAGVDHRLQLVGGAQGQMPAMIHDENAVADLLDLLHVMARVNHRRAFVVKTLNEAGTQQALEQLRALPCVMSADYDGHELTVRCRRGDHNLLDVLTLLKSNGTNIGHLSSRQPTLNDVFLELTGTALRD